MQMINFRFTLILSILFFSCQPQVESTSASKSNCTETKGALLGSRFNSFEALNKSIQIEYKKDGNPKVIITHDCSGHKIKSILEKGISEKDFKNVSSSSFVDKVILAIKMPYLVIHQAELRRVYWLARRRGDLFGENDKAFYDIALALTDDLILNNADTINPRDLSEKGYLNTFNHITAQAFITSMFSEELADFIADSHERANMPELVTGEFTSEQIEDLNTGPLDNYVDIVNNEWGQEIGKKLKAKYNINRHTVWDATLMQNFMNDIKTYCSWALQIEFKPSRLEDELLTKFANKINRTSKDIKASF